ncbi:MAG: sugar ABC transporter ATP-binding protein [Fibrobacter sp.]|nr:sugar ABC transporter ATP-binding protein [Fibrobacter sp.]
MASEIVLSMENICKSFPGVKALLNVKFRMFKGEVHALMGQNGAGKSTLIKVLTGVYPHDSGIITLNGKQVVAENPLAAQKLGISTVYQEVNLCPNLSVAENIFIGREPKRNGLIDWKNINTKADELLKKLNIKIDVTEMLSTYSIAVQQMVAIARAISISAKVLILDEPTSSLDENEVNLLFSVIKKLKAEGMAILFVTHFMDQMYEISDRITVLRNGTFVGEYLAEELPRKDLISAMIGKDYTRTDEQDKRRNDYAALKDIQPFFKASNIERKGHVSSVSIECKKGEILGLAGLLGSGRTEVVRLIFGVDKPDKGEFTLNGKKITLNSPMQAILNGFGFCPEDRKVEGIIGDLTIRENIILALQGTQGIFKNIPESKQVELADKYIKALGIKATDSEQVISKLSGGNQQKVILARWLATNPKLLILDEPTRGIDISAKEEIMDLVIELCKEGMSIIFISSELEEVVRCCDRVAVMCDRKKIAELTGDEISEEQILHVIAGGTK